MTDDWSTPTGEHLRSDHVADERTPVPARFLSAEDDARVIDAFVHELALDASDDPSASTAEEQEEERSLLEWVAALMTRSP